MNDYEDPYGYHDDVPYGYYDDEPNPEPNIKPQIWYRQQCETYFFFIMLMQNQFQAGYVIVNGVAREYHYPDFWQIMK